jgi:hypothetical protein
VTGRRPFGDETGSGVLSTSLAVVVFLTFLLFTVQVLVGLYGRSVVTAAAYDGARRVAGHQGAGMSEARARTIAEAQMRQTLGDLPVRFDWSASTADVVSLHIEADSPRVLAPGFTGPLATDHIERTVTVRVERLR